MSGYDPEADDRERARSPWTAAYRGALDNGLPEAEARKYADERLAEIRQDRADDRALERWERSRD